MRLIVMRHAKSSWEYSHLADHDRPLSKRGRKSSDAIGKWLVENGYAPKVVISSTSQRTRETWEIVSQHLPQACHVRFAKELYHGGSGSFFSQLAQVDVSPALLLGHNPGIGFFANSILQQTPKDAAFQKYPTAATLVCDFPISRWSNAECGMASLVDFVVPRSLV